MLAADGAGGKIAMLAQRPPRDNCCVTEVKHSTKGTLSILLAGDLHGREEGLDWLMRQLAAERPDLLLFVGDFITGKPLPFVREVLREIRGHADHIYVVPGNWDPRESLIIFDEESLDGLRNLHRASALLAGWHFAGLGGSITTPPRNTPFEQPDDEAFSEPFAMQLPADVWLLHNPIHGQGDVIANGNHVGSKKLRELYDSQEEKPRLVLSGHIHEAFGTAREGETTFVNAGPLFEKRCARIVLAPGGVSAELVQG
jgi:Icc-related predicted phosphoesterase